MKRVNLEAGRNGCRPCFGVEQRRRNRCRKLSDVVQNTQPGKRKSVMGAVQPEEIGGIKKIRKLEGGMYRLGKV
jgi:hypothetical protein